MNERNLRVARRAGGVDAGAAGDDRLPRLTVPREAAVTPPLFALLRTLAPDRPCRIVWHPVHPPLRWDVPTCAPAPATDPEELLLHEPLVLDVSTAAARRDSAWQLLRQSGKPQDGWLSRHVHRKVSRAFSYVFLSLGLSANAATFFAFAVGIGGAAFMAATSHATMIAGAFLFWFASIADGIDGEMARLTLSESRFGEQLDTGVDQLTHLAGIVGVLIGWSRQGIDAAGTALAAGVVIGTPALLLWAMTLVRRARGTAQFFVPTKPIEVAIFAAARETGAWPLRATAAVFVLFRREAFSFAFFVISLATGQRAAIPATIAVGLAVVLLTFLVYGPTLSRMLRETVDPRAAAATTVRSAARSSVRA